MDAFIYRAALYCGRCMIESLIAQGKASPAARDMAPADALEQIVESSGFTCESDYDSDDLPKGPFGNGGGEADSPQHCDTCGEFLRNPLTSEGRRYVARMCEPYTVGAPSTAELVQRLKDAGYHVKAEWADFYEIGA